VAMLATLGPQPLRIGVLDVDIFPGNKIGDPDRPTELKARLTLGRQGLERGAAGLIYAELGKQSKTRAPSSPAQPRRMRLRATDVLSFRLSLFVTRRTGTWFHQPGLVRCGNRLGTVPKSELH
jgi:hypothetical protein